jgi:hypothetical protein
MMRPPIKVRIPIGTSEKPVVPLPPVQTVEMPPNAVLDAGAATFLAFASRHWPTRQGDGSFQLAAFDYRDPHHLRTTLAMVYFAMREAGK